MLLKQFLLLRRWHDIVWNYFQSLDIGVKLRVDTARSAGTTNLARVKTILVQQERT